MKQRLVKFQPNPTTDPQNCRLQHSLAIAAWLSCLVCRQTPSECQPHHACLVADSMLCWSLHWDHCILYHSLRLLGCLLWPGGCCQCRACNSKITVLYGCDGLITVVITTINDNHNNNSDNNNADDGMKIPYSSICAVCVAQVLSRQAGLFCASL